MIQGQHAYQADKSGLVALASGMGIIIIVFGVQFLEFYGGKSITLTEVQQIWYQRSAIPTLGVVFTATVLSLFGFVRILKAWQYAPKGDGIFARTREIISRGLIERSRIFWCTLFAYTIFFGFASGTFIYSAQSYSERFGVSAPSYFMTGCCGQPGAFPILSVYLTENLGLLVTPLGLVLMAYLPLAVSINAVVIARAKTKNISGVICGIAKNPSIYGASTGVLAGCPTCAASLLLALAGGTSALGVTASLLANYQPAIVLASFGLLLVGPIIASLRR